MKKMTSSDVQFSFNYEIYSQIDAVAQGPPLGPTLANIFVGYLEYKTIEDLSSQIVCIRQFDECLFISKTEG